MNELKFNQIKEILKMWEETNFTHIDIFKYNIQIYLKAIDAIIKSKTKKK